MFLQEKYCGIGKISFILQDCQKWIEVSLTQKHFSLLIFNLLWTYKIAELTFAYTFVDGEVLSYTYNFSRFLDLKT